MKKIGILVMVLGILTACSNTATLENKADSLGKKADSLSSRVWDSVKSGSKELKERIEKQFEKKDTADK
jgi:maltose-binding protein MalE